MGQRTEHRGQNPWSHVARRRGQRGGPFEYANEQQGTGPKVGSPPCSQVLLSDRALQGGPGDIKRQAARTQLGGHCTYVDAMATWASKKGGGLTCSPLDPVSPRSP
jgi:hypothetical protein